jgi:hypothetical protein
MVKGGERLYIVEKLPWEGVLRWGGGPDHDKKITVFDYAVRDLLEFPMGILLMESLVISPRTGSAQGTGDLLEKTR